MLMVPPQVFWPYFAAVVSSAVAVAATWRPFAGSSGLDKLRVLGPAAFAIPLVIFGAEHFASAREIMRIVPSWMPGRLFWTYFVGVALISSGFSIILGIKQRLSSTLLGIMFFLFVVLMHVPNAVRQALGAHFASSPAERILWAVAGRDLVFGCGAFLLALSASQATVRERFEPWLVRGIAVVALLFGFVHFWYPRFAPGVPLERRNPDWMPGGPAWGYVTGSVLVLGAIGMLLRRSTRRSAAMALGVALVVLVAIFYVPIMLAERDLESLNYVADTLLFAASVLICAGAPAAQDVLTPRS